MLTRERLLTHDETIAKILTEFDARIWKTADDNCQLRLLSRYEVEWWCLSLKCNSGKLIAINPV